MNEIETHELSPNPHIPVKYREWVQDFYSKLDIGQLDPNDIVFQLPLSKVYVPLVTVNPFFLTPKTKSLRRKGVINADPLAWEMRQKKKSHLLSISRNW